MNQQSLNEMDRELWLEWRRAGIGSSDAASIMKHPEAFGTPFQVWEEKVFGSTKEDNFAMRRGRDFEEKARQCYIRKTGIQVKPANIIHPEYSWIRSSFDGLTEDGKRGVEIKISGKKDYGLALEGIISPKYDIQMQHQWQTEQRLEQHDYFSYNLEEDDGVIIHSERKSDYIAELFAAEQAFWQMVLSGEAPPLMERDYVSLEGDCLLLEFIENRRLLKTMEERDKQLLEHLKVNAGDRSFKGNGVKLTKSVCRGPLDYKKACDDHKIALDNYRKASYVKWTSSGI